MSRGSDSPPGRRTSKRVAAYVDGALVGSRRDRTGRDVEADPALRAEAERIGALGALTRESWSEGPPAPAPEYLIAALRPELTRVDRELASRSWRSRAARWLAELGRPAPVGLLAGAATLLVLATVGPGVDPPSPSQGATAGSGLRASAPADFERASSARARAPRPTAAFAPGMLRSAGSGSELPASNLPGFANPEFFHTASPWGAPSFDAAGEIYDIASDGPMMIFQAEDGDTVIWLLDEEQDLSLRRRPGGEGWAEAA